MPKIPFNSLGLSDFAYVRSLYFRYKEKIKRNAQKFTILWASQDVVSSISKIALRNLNYVNCFCEKLDYFGDF